MIKNKENLKEELKKKMNKEIEQYVDAIDEGFHHEYFPIDEIEKLWGDAINGCNAVLKNGTEQMLNSIKEAEFISKKKAN